MTEEQEEQARKGGDGDCVRASELVLVCVCVCVCVRVCNKQQSRVAQSP